MRLSNNPVPKRFKTYLICEHAVWMTVQFSQNVLNRDCPKCPDTGHLDGIDWFAQVNSLTSSSKPWPDNVPTDL